MKLSKKKYKISEILSSGNVREMSKKVEELPRENFEGFACEKVLKFKQVQILRFENYFEILI